MKQFKFMKASQKTIIINFPKSTSISRISLWYSIVVGTPGDTQKCYDTNMDGKEMHVLIQYGVPLLKASFKTRIADNKQNLK